MHYKNGREAKPGDKVIAVVNGIVTTGIIHSLKPEATTCNARVSPTTHSDAYVTLADCMHVDDVSAVMEATKPGAKPELNLG